ncbi:MAG: DUF4381 domain-containing protein [Rhodovulum sulfidophilum]|uniref:DUF4381 domain-containing protein n=1 Tax=Rhodovulum sulfidophilum TaxID=35806 RepID=A0A2W5Q0S7_RHOSU|nr:MAG: DUF4381 domain-containing protein [Rhodovulum sulfidophilum]
MERQGGDSLVGLLGQLHDIVEPPPVSMWPATWTWAVLAAVLVAALAFGAVLFLRHRRATAWRRAALAELAALGPGLAAGAPEALAGLQTLLRRVALATAPRAEVAALTGADWAGYLAATGGDFGPVGPALAEAPYRPRRGYDGARALAAARAWIRQRHA